MKTISMRPYLYSALFVMTLFCIKPASATESLVDAVREGDKVKLKALIAAGEKVEGESGGFALYWAIKRNMYDVASMLVTKGADLNVHGPQNGFTPLHETVSYAGIVTEATPGADQISAYRLPPDFSLDKLPMNSAILKNKMELANLMIAHGADVNIGSKYGDSPLHRAGSAELAEMLIRHGAKVNAMNINNNTPLYGAINIGKNLVELLITNGADVNNVDKSGYTPLHVALNLHRTDIAGLLIAHGADVNIKSSNGQTLLDLALGSKNAEFASLLIANGAKTSTNNRQGNSSLDKAINTGDLHLVETMLKNGEMKSISRSPLFAAVSSKRKDMVELLLRYGADVNAGVNEGTPLLHQIRDKAILELLLGHGADPNVRDRGGDTLLWHVCYDSELAESLLKHGADINIRNMNGRSVLHLASRYARDEVTEWLLQHGANVNAVDDEGMTPFLDAVRSYERRSATPLGLPAVIAIPAGISSSDLKKLMREANKATPAGDLAMPFPAGFDTDNSRATVKLLLSHGARSDVTDRWGQTALHFASTGDIADLLLRKKVDVNARRVDGATALHLAAAYGRNEVVEVLLKHGADVNTAMRNGATPLHYAKSTEVVEMLLAKGARVDAVDNQGNTSLHFANEAGVVELLLKYGAPLNEKNNSGQTPLMMSIRTFIGDFEDGQIFIYADPLTARRRSSKGAVWAMLDHGADVNMEDSEQHAPSHYLRAAIASSSVDEIAESLQELDGRLVAHGAPAPAPVSVETTRVQPVIPPELAGIPQIALGMRVVMQSDVLHKARLKAGRESHLYYLDSEGDLPARGKPAFDDARQLLDYYQRQSPGLRDKGLWIKRMAKRLQGSRDAKSADELTVMAKSENISLFLCDPAMSENNQWAAEWECKQVSPRRKAQSMKSQGIQNCDDMDLTKAIVRSNMECLEMLLANGTDPGEITERETPPLVNAIYNQNPDFLRKLIQYGADLNAMDSLGMPMLFHAIYAYAGLMSNGYRAQAGSNKQSLQAFLDNKADTSIKDRYGNSALHLAAELGNKNLIRIFLREDLLHTVNKFGNPPIAKAALRDKYEAMKMLIDAGFDPDRSENRTVVNAATGSNCVECLELLLMQGAKVNEEDQNGITPMQIAVLSLDEPRLALLSKYGGDPLHIDKHGDTLLHYLFNSGHYNRGKAIAVTRLLLKLGVDKTRKNNSGRTALEHIPAYFQETENELVSLLSLNASRNVKPRKKE